MSSELERLGPSAADADPNGFRVRLCSRTYLPGGDTSRLQSTDVSAPDHGG